MPDIDSDSLVERLTLAGLISPDQLREAREEADAEGGSAEAVVRACLRKDWITSWQVDRLKKGNAADFQYGPYRALFPLAEGTFGRVYRGERSDTGEPVAIKALRGRFAADPAAAAAFQKEAEAGMRLRHDHIVRILDFGRHDEKHFIAMEYVEGMNLRDFLRVRGRLGGEEALPLMIELAEALRYSHERGVAHRDLKPTNVLIAHSGVAKLVDFGLADLGSDPQGAQRTIDYSALERTCGSPKGDPRSDIYFLGTVFYYMLAGHPPLEDAESKDKLRKLLKRSFSNVRPLAELPQPPDRRLARVIEKMMTVDLKTRYQTVAEVVADLEAFRDGRPDADVEAGSDDALALDPELKSALLRNPFLTADPDAPETAEEPPAVAVDDVADAEDLDPATFETRSDESVDLAAVLGLPTAETVPSAAPASTPKPTPKPAAEAGEVRAFAQPTLLCVETQTEIQDALRKNLTKSGYRVFLIADSERAADRFRDGPTDLVLFDLDGQGPDAIAHLADMWDKTEEDGVPLRVLVLLGRRQKELRGDLPPADGMVVLDKPVKLREVQEALEALLPPG